MKILLRKQNDNTIAALNADDGSALTRITNPSVWCDNDDLCTGYEHPEGIFWNDIESAKTQLNKHEIITD